MVPVLERREHSVHYLLEVPAGKCKMDPRTDKFLVGEGSFDMGEKGRLMIDLNACDTELEDLSHEELRPAPARGIGEAMQVDCFTRSEQEITKPQEAAEDPNSFEEEDISETMNLVKKFHLRTAATGEMAEFRGVAGSEVDGRFVACECCGKPESQGMTLICDGCQRSFHVGCMKLRSKHAAEFNEWFCSSCATKGFRQPWSLGRVESEKEVQGGWIRRDTGDANLISEKEQSSGTGTRLSSGGSQEDGQRKLKQGPEINNDTTKRPLGAGFSGSEETRARGRPRVKLVSCLKEDDQTKETISSSAGKSQFLEYESNEVYDGDEDDNQLTDSPWQPVKGNSGTQKLLFVTGNSTASGKRESPQSSLSFSSEDQVDDAETSSKEINLRKLGKQHMQKLKELISQLHGVLEDGWDVGVKKRTSGDKVFDVTFYSPDGLKFRSRLEVARYLGLLEHKKGDATFREYFSPSARSKKRKDFARTKKHGYESEDDDESDGESQDTAKRRKRDVHTSSYSQDLLCNFDLQLPLQCMDVTVESLGVVDLRPQYCDEIHIWPVGYSCAWHDAVTESFCLSEVLDGGISGPVFRVTRKSFSVLSDSKDVNYLQGPDGAHRNSYLVNGDHLHYSEWEQKGQECAEQHVHGNTIPPGCGNSYVKSVEMKIPSELHSHCETRLNGGSIQLYDDEDQDEDELQVLLGNFRNVLPDVMAGNGELCSMQVWEGAPWGEKLNNTCDSIQEMGIEQIFRMESAIELKKNNEVADSELKEERKLVKEGKPPLEVIARDQEDVSQVFNELKRKSAFFSDEIGEIVAEGRSSSEAWECLGKQFLERFCECYRRYRQDNVRLGSPHSETILSCASESNLKDMLEGVGIRNIGEDELNFESLCSILKLWMGQDRFGFDIPAVHRLIKARKARLEATRPPPPCGRPIGNKVPAELVGDLLQIWEFLCRFSELLGQKEPPSLEDLEEGICDPWKTETGNKSNTCCKRDTTSKVQKSSNLVRDDLGATAEPGCIEAAVLDCLEEQGMQNGKIESISEPVSEQLRSKKNLKASSLGAGCRSLVLASLHISLLKILVADLQQKLSSGPDLISETKRGKKKEGESGPTSKRQTDCFLTLNEITWEEVARRYVVALSALNTSGENIDITFQERQNILHCLQGDGGVLCGGLDGVARIEADAQLLAEAEKHVSGCLESTKSESKSSAETPEKENDDVKRVGDVTSKVGRERPAWAKVLEPVRKLATNVGARIRNCVREALERDPPEWAKEILEWSISKEVYKGNASGPTKRAVLSVLDHLKGEEQELKVKKMKKIKYVIPTPVLVMNRCRILLRQLIFSDEVRVFCNTLSGMVLGFYLNVEDGTEIAPPMVSRPLDFRIIDSRLAAGWYGESHELFAADIRQLWRNIPIVFCEREDMIKIGESLSQQFEALYQKQVIELVSGKEEVKEMSETSKNEDSQQPSGSGHELLKAPWEEGVCKICGIDKDDDNTLLCDGCDAEYHIYCLDPPLSKIPDGNWYCPSCIAHEMGISDPALGKDLNKASKGLSRTASTCKGGLQTLAVSMREKEYWQLSVAERMILLKFLCEKVLDSTLIREHVEQSIEALFEVQQKLRSLTMERQSQILKGSNPGSDNFTVEHTEAVNKEVSATKKRGRKITRGGNVTSIMEEIGRPGSGLEEIMMHGGDESTEPSVWGKQGSGTEEENSTRNRARILASIVQDRDVEKHQTSFIPLHDYGTKKSSEISWINNHGITSVVEESRSEFKGDFQASDNVLMGSGKVGWRMHQMHAGEISQWLDRQQQGGIDSVNGQYQLGNHMQNVSYNHNNNFEEEGAVYVTEMQEEKLQFGFQGMKRNAEGSYAECKGSSNPPMSCMESQVDLVENTAAEEIRYVKTSQQFQQESGVVEQQGQTESLLQVADAEQGVSTLSNVREAGMGVAMTGQIVSEALDMEIEKVEAELMKMAVRRECLGRDALDRVYWALGWEGKYPWLVIEGAISSTAQGSETKTYGPIQHDIAAASEIIATMCRRERMEHIESNALNSHAAWSIGGQAQSGVRRWIAYESDTEFQELLGWLRTNIQRERNLKSSIIRWQMSWSTRSCKNRLGSDINLKQPTKGKAAVSSFPSTKASVLLVKKFGPFSRSEGLDEFCGKKRGRVRKVLAEEQLFRCECLEPVWPARSHCQCCHETFESSTDLQSHNNGECFSIVSAVKEQPSNLPASPKVKKRKGKIKTEKGRGRESNGVVKPRKKKTNGKGCRFVPPDFSVVVRNFSTTSTTRERILQIGCIADDGPSFAPALSFSPVFDPSLIMNLNANNNLLSDITNLGLQLSTCQPTIASSSCFSKDGDQNTELTRADNTAMFEQHKTEDAILAQSGVLGSRFSNVLFRGGDDLSTLEKCQQERSDNRILISSPAVVPVPPFQISAPEAANDGKRQDPEVRNPYSIEEETRLHNGRVDQSTDGKSLFPTTAMLPLSGRHLWILKKLKSNLLDMEAILADEALESSRGNPIQRRAWRCFLKSTNSIYGVVLAVIFFEQILKGDYLRDSWGEWASPSALARTSTLTSLALRIYSLDAAIKYKKAILAFDMKDSEKQNKPGRKKKT